MLRRTCGDPANHVYLTHLRNRARDAASTLFDKHLDFGRCDIRIGLRVPNQTARLHCVNPGDALNVALLQSASVLRNADEMPTSLIAIRIPCLTSVPSKV